MATLRRLTDSCLTLSTDDGTTLFDPGFFTWSGGDVDLEHLGEVQRILITHRHGDHMHPEFIRWLLDRGDDVAVYGNADVATILSGHDIEVRTGVPEGASVEDVLHEEIPTGDTPPNRAWTIDGMFTHPGDSYQPTTAAPVLALPLVTPWGSATASVAFAKRLGVSQVVPVHDFYLSASGREFVAGLAKKGLEPAGIEVLDLDWGESATL